MFMRRFAQGTIVLGFCAWTYAASAGWVIDQVTKDNDMRQQVLAQDNQLKTTLLSQDGKPQGAIVINADAQTITQINYDKGEYTTAPMQEYIQLMQNLRKTIAPKIADAMKKMEEAMKRVPPGPQRQMMEEMMQSRKEQMMPTGQECPEPPQVETHKTDQQDTIAGYTAVRYDVVADGKPQSELWIAKDITVGQDFDMSKMQMFLTEMAKLAACSPGAKQQGLLGGDAWKLLSQGYPARTVDSSGGGGTVEVIKAEKRSVTPKEFQPPANFTAKTLQELMTPQGISK